MKAVKINNNIATSVVLMIAGIMVMILPSLLGALITTIGVVIVLIAVFDLLVRNDIGRGVSGSITGLLIIMIPHFIEFGIPLAIAIILIANGVKLISSSFTMKLGSAREIAKLVIGAVLILLSLLLLTHHSEFNSLVKRIVGGVLILVGILRLIPGFVVTDPKKPRKHGSDVIDVDYEEN